LAIKALSEAAETKDNPADLINLALETLIKERYELPVFSTLDRLVRRVRPVFLLQYLSDPEMRKQITEMTNKVEAYNGFAGWLFFGGEGIIADNDPEKQEKIISHYRKALYCSRSKSKRQIAEAMSYFLHVSRLYPDKARDEMMFVE
jgi:hypothetical protein